MKRRLLFLGAAIAVFSSLAVGGGLSFTIPDDTDTSDAVGVYAPTGATVDLNQINGTIAADNAYHAIDEVLVDDADTNYNYTLTHLVVSNEGISSNCGSHDYGLNSVGGNDDSGALSIAVGTNTLVDYMLLKIDPAGTDTSCSVSGGEITASFTTP